METLEQIYDGKDRRLTGAEEEAEGRRGALVRLGWCSGQGWCRGRRRRRSSEDWATRGRGSRRARRGKKEWPFGPIYKARDMGQARKSRSRKFGNRVVASIIADLLNKKVSWIISLWQMTSRRFTAIREDDITVVHQTTRRCWRWNFC